MLEAAEEEGVADSHAHVQIRALFNKQHNAQPPPRNNISYIIMPEQEQEEEEEETIDWRRLTGQPPTPSAAKAAATKIIDASLQKPVDPQKLAGSKVHTGTCTMPLLAQPLTSCTAVVWPSTSSPDPGTRRVFTASVEAQRPTPHLGTDVRIPARGMS